MRADPRSEMAQEGLRPMAVPFLAQQVSPMVRSLSPLVSTPLTRMGRFPEAPYGVYVYCRDHAVL